MNKRFDLVRCDNFIFQAKEEARKAAAANNAELQVKIKFKSTSINFTLKLVEFAHKICSFLSTAIPQMATSVEVTVSSPERWIGRLQVGTLLICRCRGPANFYCDVFILRPVASGRFAPKQRNGAR